MNIQAGNVVSLCGRCVGVGAIGTGAYLLRAATSLQTPPTQSLTGNSEGWSHAVVAMTGPIQEILKLP